jgi:FtsP/CotA-like multicopper oxidase with cupredoxin domain
MNGTRRDFIRAGAVAGAGLMLGSHVSADGLSPADVTLRIGPVRLEFAPDHIISTTGYNGSVPGAVIRLHEGRPASVELINDTDTPELVHWHGLRLPSDIDGAVEEGTPFIPPHQARRYTLTPQPAGTRWVHTHVVAGSDLHSGTYTGQFGMVYIEPKSDPGRYDREVFLATHEWEPFLGSGEAEAAGEMDRDTETWPKGTVPPVAPPDPRPNGYEVGYRAFTINGNPLGRGEPVRVKRGERVIFRILNASATENLQLAFAGHEFEVVALDGNPVPTPRKVAALALGVAERIDAVVEMNNPGVWILGSTHDEDRRDGMGIVIEYAGSVGEAQWIRQARGPWDYTLFGQARGVPAPDQTIPMVFGKINGGRNGFNRWTINGQSFEHSAPIDLRRGLRYRLAFRNQTDDAHPVHLHRHSFEIVRVNGKPTAGVLKDTVVVPEFGTVDVDFVADNPGPTLFHCHQALHMNYGFMQLFRYG